MLTHPRRMGREQTSSGGASSAHVKHSDIGRLAGGIAHDLNNILGAILGYGELAQNNLVEGDAVRHQIDPQRANQAGDLRRLDRRCRGCKGHRYQTGNRLGGVCLVPAWAAEFVWSPSVARICRWAIRCWAQNRVQAPD
jgi:hypothetical protein